MAIAIKSTPILTGDSAIKFIKLAESNFRNKKASVDFKKEIELTQKILAKAKI